MSPNTFLRWLSQVKRFPLRWKQTPNTRTLKYVIRPQLEGLEERLVPAAPYTPAQIRAAYGVDQIKFGAGTVGNGAGQTIGIAVIGTDSTLASDLQHFDTTVYPSGENDSQLLDTFAKDASGKYTDTGPVTGSTKPWLDILQDQNWLDQNPNQTIPPGTPQTDLEAAEDVEWAHVIAPMANILLVETGDIAVGAGYAAKQSQLGVSVVAVSSSHHPYIDPSEYTQPGVTFVAITGDTGTSINSALVGFSNNNYPASTPDVIAVGGTTLTLNADGSYGSETGWGFASPNRFLTSGTASYSPAPSWTSTAGGFSGTYETAPVGGPINPRAIWTTTVTSSDTLGRNDLGLEISATWTASPSNSPDAQYVIFDNGAPVQTVLVNQQLAPTGTTGTQNSRTATFQELCALSGKETPTTSGPLLQVGDIITIVLQGQSIGNISDGKLVADAIGIGPDDASGGGISDDPFQPDFQAGLVIHDGSSVISSGGRRSTPDVAFDGDYVNSPVVIYSDGTMRQGAGTSLGAPCWGALIAIADQGLATVGRGPMDTATALAGLYSLPSSDFHDETSGYNGFSAGPGYDLVTGLGSPVANQLLPDLDKAIVTHFQISGPTGATAGVAVKETVTALNAYGNVVSTYTGTVHFTSSDASASLPGDYTFLASDEGSHTFTFTLQSLGPQNVTATDTSIGGLTGKGLVYTAKASLPSAQLATVAYELTHSYQYYYTFVAGAYEQYLSRVPSLSEANGWVVDMQNGLSDEQLQAGFIGSAEYISDHGGAGAGWVIGMYQNLLGRTPAAAEVAGWVQALANGWTTNAVAYGFAASVEAESDRVTADYKTYLNRVPAQAEVQGWVNDFERGLSNETVIGGFVGSLEYYDKNGGGPSAWLDAAYVGLFGGHADLGAFQSWMPVLL
jgi:subtilase family serine protease